MKTYIWAYEATTCNGVGIIKGRIEATTGYAAQELVKDRNLLIETVKVKLLKNQAQARKERFESIEVLVA